MKNKIILLIAFPIMLIILGFVIISAYSHLDVALNEFDYVTPFESPQGHLKYKLTFDNIINKYSSNIVIGKVISSEEHTSNSNMYKVEVYENLVGEVDHSIIYVNADKNNLISGNKYILFMREMDSPLQKAVFYVNLNPFTVKIDENNNLYLLESPENEKYIKPFKKEDYNSLANAKKYIEKVKKDNIFINKIKEKVIDEAKDTNELIKLSDHIIEISVENLKISGEINNIAIVDYDCYKKYKGGSFENISSLLLPDKIEMNKKYLLFLKGDSESVTLATRKGSVIEVGTNEYYDILNQLEE